LSLWREMTLHSQRPALKTHGMLCQKYVFLDKRPRQPGEHDSRLETHHGRRTMHRFRQNSFQTQERARRADLTDLKPTREPTVLPNIPSE
jgi:hypothetical protein